MDVAKASSEDAGLKVLSENDACRFAVNYNVNHFSFSHRLANSSLFDLDRVAELGNFLQQRPSRGHLAGHVSICQDDIMVEQGWCREAAVGARAASCIERISSSNSWVLLRGIQVHPDYTHILGDFIDDLECLMGQPIRDTISWIDAYLFVSSPGMVTGYHIDHETNFLMQIHGTKQISLVDPANRDVLTEQEVERYYIGDVNVATFTELAQRQATTYDLSAGTGVHHPPLAPHWAVTGPEYSVSLSIPFCVRKFDRQAKAHQANHYLRRLGLRPSPPGVSDFKDGVKAWVMGDMGHRPLTKYDLIRFGVNKFRTPVRSLRTYIREALHSLSGNHATLDGDPSFLLKASDPGECRTTK